MHNTANNGNATRKDGIPYVDHFVGLFLLYALVFGNLLGSEVEGDFAQARQRVIEEALQFYKATPHADRAALRFSQVLFLLSTLQVKFKLTRKSPENLLAHGAEYDSSTIRCRLSL